MCPESLNHWVYVILSSASTRAVERRISAAPAPEPVTSNFAMKLRSSSPTPSRTARCSAAHRSDQAGIPQVGVAGGGLAAPAYHCGLSHPETSRRCPPAATRRSCTGECRIPRAEVSCLPGVWAA